MKKLLLTIMFVICAVLLSACSKNELELGTYTTENSSSKLILLEDQKFEFHPYFLYGYSPNGDYRIEKGKLILHVNDEEEYVFKIKKDYIIFESSSYDEYLKGLEYRLKVKSE